MMLDEDKIRSLIVYWRATCGGESAALWDAADDLERVLAGKPIIDLRSMEYVSARVDKEIIQKLGGIDRAEETC